MSKAYFLAVKLLELTVKIREVRKMHKLHDDRRCNRRILVLIADK